MTKTYHGLFMFDNSIQTPKVEFVIERNLFNLPKKKEINSDTSNCIFSFSSLYVFNREKLQKQIDLVLQNIFEFARVDKFGRNTFFYQLIHELFEKNIGSVKRRGSPPNRNPDYLYQVKLPESYETECLKLYLLISSNKKYIK